MISPRPYSTCLYGALPSISWPQAGTSSTPSAPPTSCHSTSRLTRTSTSPCATSSIPTTVPTSNLPSPTTRLPTHRTTVTTSTATSLSADAANSLSTTSAWCSRRMPSTLTRGEVITTITIIDTSAPPASLSRARCVPKTSPSTFGTPPTAGSSYHSPSMSR